MLRFNSVLQKTLNDRRNKEIKAVFDEHGGATWVLDNVSYQNKGCDLLQENSSWWDGPFNRQMHPKYSPDFNQPVEHAHATVWKAFQNWLTQQTQPYSADGYQKAFTRVAKTVITAEIVAKDVQRLPDLYRVVSSSPTDIVVVKGKEYRGVAGNWPPKALR